MNVEDKNSPKPAGEKKVIKRLQFDIPDGATPEEVADKIADQILGLLPKKSSEDE